MRFGCGSDVLRTWFRCGSDVVRMWFGCGSGVGRMWFGRVFGSGADSLAEVKGRWFPASVHLISEILRWTAGCNFGLLYPWVYLTEMLRELYSVMLVEELQKTKLLWNLFSNILVCNGTTESFPSLPLVQLWISPNSSVSPKAILGKATLLNFPFFCRFFSH